MYIGEYEVYLGVNKVYIGKYKAYRSLVPTSNLAKTRRCEAAA